MNKKPIYATVVLMNGQPWYSKFSEDAQELIDFAEGLGYGVIRVEKAHSKEPPIWERKEDET